MNVEIKHVALFIKKPESNMDGVGYTLQRVFVSNILSPGIYPKSDIVLAGKANPVEAIFESCFLNIQGEDEASQLVKRAASELDQVPEDIADALGTKEQVVVFSL